MLVCSGRHMVTLALSLNRGLLSHLDSNTIAHWNSHKWSLENRLTAWVIVWGRGKSLLSCLPGASYSALLLGEVELYSISGRGLWF